MFLSPTECSVGYVGSITKLTLVVPRRRHDLSAIVMPDDGRLIAVFLDGEFTFSSFDCTDNKTWQGLLIPGVNIELDLSSIFDPSASDELLGSVVRKKNVLGIVAKAEGDIFGPRVLPVIKNLPEGDGKLSAGFRTWSVVIGEGNTKRALKVIQVGQARQA